MTGPEAKPAMGTEPIAGGFTPEQASLWQNVAALWELSRSRDPTRIEAALHPCYLGWDMRAPSPHDRKAAVASVCGDAPQLESYVLEPLSVRVYEGQVGIVLYAFAATVVPEASDPVRVTGKWMEVYLRQGPDWVMLAVSGMPEPARSG